VAKNLLYPVQEIYNYYNLEISTLFLIPNIRANKRIGPHNHDIISVIFGSLLGDAYANTRTGEGVRICYRQSNIHKEYLFYLYEFFFINSYVSNLKPRQYIIKLNSNKIYYGYEFNTFTFRSFNWIHKIFYKNGKKILPHIDQLSIYLTPLALAIWIMDDGGFVRHGIRLSTYNFTKEEHNTLVLFFKLKYNIDCTIQLIPKTDSDRVDNRYCLYIKSNSLNKIRNLILPYLVPSMKYKVGI